MTKCISYYISIAQTIDPFVGTVEDITDRKAAEAALRESEAKFQRLAANISSVLYQYVLHPDGSDALTYISSKCREIYEYEPETLQQNFQLVWSMIHPDDVERVRAANQASAQTLEPFEMEFRLIPPSGRLKWISCQSQPNPQADGDIVWDGLVTDISDRVQFERDRERILQQEQAAREEAEAAREEAEAANRSKDEFVAVVAHELRSPLNAIIGWAKLLQSRQLDAERVNKALDTIVRNAQSQAKLVEDLLDVSRMGREALQMDFAPVSLSEVIQTAIETVRPTAEAKQLQLELQRSPVPLLQCDANRLQQVVLNLLTNAIKFTPEGGRIQVRLNQMNHELQLQVQDTGRGISPDFLPYIFERFRQDKQNTAAKQGLGLGLAIVKYIVEQHGGTVTAESQGEGTGATFTVLLPLLQHGGSEQDDTLMPPLPQSSQSLAGLRVLLVDDEIDMLNLTAFILELEGAVVQTAASGTLALQCFPLFQPDILISDIAMPELNGYELLQQVRQIDPGGGIPAIACTAYASEARKEDSLRAGFAYHLTKPVELEELVSVILDGLQRRAV